MQGCRGWGCIVRVVTSSCLMSVLVLRAKISRTQTTILCTMQWATCCNADLHPRPAPRPAPRQPYLNTQKSSFFSSCLRHAPGPQHGSAEPVGNQSYKSQRPPPLRRKTMMCSRMPAQRSWHSCSSDDQSSSLHIACLLPCPALPCPTLPRPGQLPE